MEGFIDRYGDSLHRWWKTMSEVRLSPDIGRLLAAGLKAEEAGRNYEELTSERDRAIVAVLRALARTKGLTPPDPLF
jgi:carnitine 3-dehydrogenase